MNPIVDFYFLTETVSKDATGQTVRNLSQEICIGKMHSIYQEEYFKASQAGIRPSFVIETPSSNYNGQALILYEGHEYTIYRTYQRGLDQIELYCAERVGNNG